MKEAIATMTSKGQLTVPVEIRRALGLKPGDKVVFQLEEGDVKLFPASSRLAALYQSIPALSPARTWQAIEDIVGEERGAHFAAHDDADKP